MIGKILMITRLVMRSNSSKMTRLKKNEEMRKKIEELKKKK